VMAADDWFPHQLSHRGFRLAYSNGILAIGVAAIALVIAFGGSTNSLIPLFAVGVFLCFTLSQTGMVRHWMSERGPKWRRKAAINGTGAVVTGIVTLIVVGTKFTAGAWIVVILVPSLVALFYWVHRHYAATRAELAIDRVPPPSPAPVEVIVPVGHLNRASASALAYARSISDNVLAVHVAAEEDQSPDLEVISPLVEVVDELAAASKVPVTVAIPTIVPAHVWQEPLHNQLEYALSLALLGKPNVVIASVPVKLPG
jgi:hypothetical protein